MEISLEKLKAIIGDKECQIIILKEQINLLSQKIKELTPEKKTKK